MTWMEIPHGYINLATAQSITDLGTRNLVARRNWLVVDAAGNEHRFESTTRAIDDTAPVLPNHLTGLKCYLLRCNEAMTEVVATAFPIIGWRLCRGYAQPIMPGINLDVEGAMFIEFEDGRCVEAEYDGTHYANLEEAKAELLQDERAGAHEMAARAEP